MIKSPTRLALLLTLTAVGASWAASPAERLLRDGKPAEAWQILRRGEHGLSAEEAAYWEGRALIELGRLVEAADLLERVPVGHPLYPYSARGLLYCAKHSPELDCIAMTERLTHSQDEHIRALATAALAEQQLHSASTPSGISAYSALQEMAKGNENLQPIVKLLGLPLRRKMKDFTGGLDYARELENDASLDTTARQLARLELAELYYAKEKVSRPQGELVNPETDDEHDAAGMGEETLLQFITANPESPLLWAAFCRLRHHEKEQHSAYIHSKLNDWAEDTAHARRAACALMLLMDDAAARGADTSAFANRALTDLPGEPLTRVILQEHVRRLILRGDTKQAELYTKLLESIPIASTDAGTYFLRAMVSQDDPSKAADLFASCAEIAPDYLRIPALTNALICCMRANDPESAEKLIRTTIDEPARRALLLAHAQMLPESQAKQASAELKEVMSLHPTDAQKVRAMLCDLRLHPPTSPLLHLCNTPEYAPEKRASWSDDDDLLYAAILEKAADDSEMPDEENTLALLRRLCKEASTPRRRRVLSLHLADRLSHSGRHAEARDVLLALAENQAAGEEKAMTLLYAGDECVACATLPSLKHAIQLYAECARMGTSLAPAAIIEEAAILTRINRCAEALDLLESLSETQLSPEIRAHRLSTLADTYASCGDRQNAERALATSKAILSVPNLPHVWITRARLQHASQAARAKQDEVALEDYMYIVDEHDKMDSCPDASCNFFYYFAGAGAVYHLICMNRFDEAAKLADHIAAWSGPAPSETPRDPKKAKAFCEWARAIRSTHFLPTNILPLESKEDS